MDVAVSMRVWLHGRTDRRCGPAAHTHTSADVLRPMCAQVCVSDWALTHRRRHMRAPSVGVDRVRLGAQAFQNASAFNANIGAWNTAAVTSLANVCAAFSARAARQRQQDTLGGSSMRLAPLCAAGPPMRARVCVRRRVGTCMRGCPRVEV